MKKHIKNQKNNQPICGVAIVDASFQFIDKAEPDQMDLGSVHTCRRCIATWNKNKPKGLFK